MRQGMALRESSSPPDPEELGPEQPVRRAAVVLNASSGAIALPPPLAPDELRRFFRAAGIDAELFRGRPEELASAARCAVASGADAVVAAGGDGTVNAVAAALMGSRTRLAVLPLGTLNHFARDLGLPQDLSAAIDVIARGRTRAVDAADVNGRLFVNNSSIGLYPNAILHRDRLRSRLLLGKGSATLYAALSILRRYPQVDVALDVGGQTLHRSTPFLFVGNNRYTLHLPSIGERARLDGGELCLYVTHRPGRFGLLRLLLLALFRQVNEAREFDQFALTELTVNAPGRQSIPVALDGEVVRLTPPLHYRTRPGALRVIVADG